MGNQTQEDLLRMYVHEVWDVRTSDAVSDFSTPATYGTFRPLRRRSVGASRSTSAGASQLRLPDVSITVEDVVVGDDQFAFRSTMRGTHQEDFLEVDATGIRIEVALLDLRTTKSSSSGAARTFTTRGGNSAPTELGA